MKGLKLRPKAKPKMPSLGPMDAKGVTGLTGAMNALAGSGVAGPSLPPSAASPDADAGPMPSAPMPAPVGATDGLGSGMGGLAVHPSLRAAKIHGREPRHSSKTR